MYRIGFIGHRQGDFRIDAELLKRKINDAVERIEYQYGKGLVINVDGEIGVGQCIIDTASSFSIKYHLYLPFPIDFVGEEWYEAQRKNLVRQYDLASAVTIISNKRNKRNIRERDKRLIENSNFIICFGKRKSREEHLK